ncbi:MAG: M20 metallopeptidase family protein, partial [Anaerolineae bacterium]
AAKPAGTVRFLFQPSEEASDGEGYSGAARMVADGAMAGVDSVFGLHAIPELTTGTLGLRAGAVQASADSLHLTVHGRGAHAASPHRGRDPIFIAAQLISALQSIVSRTVDPLAPAVVSLGSIHGGTRGNIIPESIAISGTIRALDERTRDHLAAEIRRIAYLAEALGGHCDVEIERGYPVTVNDGAAVAVVRAAATALLGSESIVDTEPTMGAEDFSLLAAEASGCFARLGVTAAGQEPSRLHTPQFRLDEEALPLGAALLAACALERLTSG